MEERREEIQYMRRKDSREKMKVGECKREGPCAPYSKRGDKGAL